MSRAGSFPDLSRNQTWDQQSAREWQNVSDAAEASAQSRPGSGMTSRGTAHSQQIKGKPAAFRGLRVVAVVMEPLPDHYRLAVREVGNAFDGADYVEPDTMPEPPPPIEPIPPILQWKGNPFYAIPGFNHSVSEFAATWFSDVLRDDAGAPILADDKPIEQLPDDTTIFHWLLLRTEGPPMLFPMGGGGSIEFVVVRSIGAEAEAHATFTVQVQRIRRIRGWPPDPLPSDDVSGGWEFVGEAFVLATYPGIAAIYYKPFVWNTDIVFPDIPILRTFVDGDGETYVSQDIRWALIEVGDNVRLSACTPITQRTKELP